MEPGVLVVDDVIRDVFKKIYGSDPNGLSVKGMVGHTVEALDSAGCGIDKKTVERYLRQVFEAVNGEEFPVETQSKLCRAGEFALDLPRINSVEELQNILAYSEYSK